MPSGRSLSTDAIAPAAEASGADLAVRLPGRRAGAVPTVPRQWLAIVRDANFADLAEHLLGCATELNELLERDAGSIGRDLPRQLRELARARDRLTRSIEHMGWFSPPVEAVPSHELDNLLVDLNRLLRIVEARLRENPAPGLLSLAIESAQQSERHLRAAIQGDFTPSPAPQDLVRDVFGIDRNAPLGDPEFNFDFVEAGTKLSREEMGDLAVRQLGHLILPDAHWPPTEQLPSLLLSERPLIAHFTARYVRDLVRGVYRRDADTAARVLAARRRTSASQFASGKQAEREMDAIARAEAEHDREGIALAVARLFSNALEGPIRNMTSTILRLQGVEVPEHPSLAYLRDQLKMRAKEMGLDLSVAIEPDWRNAVDHRQYHWDPVGERLILRGQPVDTNKILQRHMLGMDVVVGTECGIALAVAASPELVSSVDRLAPLHEERVLVEGRLGRIMGTSGIPPTRIRTTPAGVVIGPLADGDRAKALSALIAGVDLLREAQSVEVRFEELPPLTVTLDALRRAASLETQEREGKPTLDANVAIPIFVSGLLALEVPPRAALERGAEAICQVWSKVVKSSLGLDRKEFAGSVAAAAERAQLTLGEVQEIAQADSPPIDELETLLQDVSRLATEYAERGELVVGAMLVAVKRFTDFADRMPGHELPWVDGDVPPGGAT